MKSAQQRNKPRASTVERAPEAAAAIPSTRPPSATNSWVILASFVTFLGSLWLVRSLKLSNPIQSTLIVTGSITLVNFALDALILKVHRRESTGLDWNKWSPSVNRTLIKFAGLLASFGFIAGLYWVFREYHGSFYHDYWNLLRVVMPWWVALAIPYFYFLDARQTNPHDGYYHAGMAVLLQFREVNLPALIQHALGWLVKGYFLALMFTYFTGDLQKFIAFDFSTIRSFRQFWDFSYDFIFLIDVGMACMGYLIALRLFDTHLRWAEPTFKGWLVALVCYQPLWSLVSRQYLDYTRDFAWGAWLEKTHWLYCLWGSAILLLYVNYVWATIIFGARFSNLTHRGILTNGPYRWLKHPAYLSKNIAYWLTFIPFIVSESVWDSIRRCVLLLFVNWIYYIRAKTEEAHLSQDPVYVQYLNWMHRHDLLRWFRKQ